MRRAFCSQARNIRTLHTTSLRRTPLTLTSLQPTHLTPVVQQSRLPAARMSSSEATTTPNTTAPPNIEATDIPTAPGVELTPHKRQLLLSVLDLFCGRPSLPKLALWTPDAAFTDPLTQARGHAQVAAQWYGLAAAFSKLERLSAECVDAGNPMRVKLKMRYTVKGINVTKEMESEVVVKTEAGKDDGKIVLVEDRWNGKLPEGAISSAFQRLNAVSVPLVVKVPKNDEEDKKMGFQ